MGGAHPTGMLSCFDIHFIFWMQDDPVKPKEAKEARNWSSVLLLHHDKNVIGEEVLAS